METQDLAHTEAAPTPALTYREILRFYFPLALSWIFMALELPITSAVASRSADPKVQTAALLMLGGLALWIESPVIDLLATSTTLSKNRRAFAVISRFTWWMMGWCAAVHALVALTPLYGLVTEGLLGVRPEVADAARLPMAIMIPWSPFIGWRRYLQGVLIRYGRTRLIGWGTAMRVAAMAGVSFGLFAWSSLSGVEMAAIALVCSVFAEAAFIHWASRGTVTHSLPVDETGAEPLTMRRLARFHLPLTATTMTFIAALPLVSAAIARSPDGVAAMAAWQVATSLVFLHRTIVFALPEPVIALYKGRRTSEKLVRFCLIVGLAASLTMALLWSTGLDRLFFEKVVGAPADVSESASLAFLACASLPLLGALQSYLRGMLTAYHSTVSRFAAVIASTTVLLVSLGIGVAQRWPGVAVAAFGMSASAVAEFLALAWAWHLAKARKGVWAEPEGL